MNQVLRFDFGRGVVLINALLAHLELLPNFHNEIWQHFTLFSWQKFGNISTQVRYSTQNTTLTQFSLSPSFRYENTATKEPNQQFFEKILTDLATIPA